MKPCRYCDKDFEPASRAQAFCSRQCAALHQHTVNPRPRRAHTRWAAKTATQKAAYGREYRRARDQVVGAAVGMPCPGCGQILTPTNATADHIAPRALGGSSSPANLRALCATCNHARGASLGGQVTAARKHLRKGLSRSQIADG